MNQRDRQQLSRRRFLTGLAAGVGCAVCGVPAFARQAKPIGIQLYTVRDRMMADLPGTLARIAEIGYREVEFAGYFGTSPAEIRRLVASNGLAAPSSHVGSLNTPDALTTDPQRIVDEAMEAGHRWIVFPVLGGAHRGSIDAYRDLADRFNVFGERCRTSGMRFAYHNHDFEFRPVDGAVPYDLLVDRTDPDLVDFQLDLYWATHAGRDSRELLARYPGRFSMCHVKDRSPDGAMVDVGTGTIDFAAIFSDPNATFEHFFVEHDRPPNSMETAEKSFAPAARAVRGAA